MRIAFTIEITIPDDTEYIGELQREIMMKTFQVAEDTLNRDDSGHVCYWATSIRTREEPYGTLAQATITPTPA